MFQLISWIAIVISCYLAYTSIQWAQIPLAIVTGLFYLLFIGMRGRRYGPVRELSPKANEMLRKFGHFYALPFAGRSLSGAASSIALGAAVVGIISAFRGFWWGLLIGIVIYLLASPLGRQFNPSGFLTDDAERSAHDEIVKYILSRRVDT
jgi:hypothetical protein